ncbi:hypothetical protein V5799_003435 [Amblyomma americanum]|uniref:Uncharacterized protein n=1 Tax=Amblyomma americanum TaxID=6943 RepID=A0AAQ4D8Z8_AMBAM
MTMKPTKVIPSCASGNDGCLATAGHLLLALFQGLARSPQLFVGSRVMWRGWGCATAASADQCLFRLYHRVGGGSELFSLWRRAPSRCSVPDRADALRRYPGQRQGRSRARP